MPHKDIHSRGLIHNYFDNKQIDGLYASTAIKSFALSFIAIFIPIYLFELGFSIQQIGIYSLIQFLAIFILFPFGMKLNSKIGIKKTMSAGIFISIIYYLLLNSLASGNINYLFISLIGGISGGLY